MGNAGQLVRSFRRRVPAHRRDEQPVLPRGAAWTVATITVVSRSALSTIVALLLWSVLPNLAGFQSTTVMSGSMEPRLQVGDAVIVRHIDAGQLSDGQVLLFDDPDHPGTLRMHRLLRVLPDGRIQTKGDANGAPDSSTVRFDAVRGAAFLRIPYAGLPNYWIRTDQPAPLIGCGVVVVLLMGGIRLGRLLEDPEERRRRRHRGMRLRGMHRATAAAVALLVLPAGAAVAVTPAQARAAYSSPTSITGNTWGTACSELATITPATPSLYYGYGSGSDPSITDLSATGDTGTFRGGASRSVCPSGASSNATFDGTSGVVTATKQNRAHPTSATIATWFKVASGDAGGVLADFGNSNVALASTAVDDALYMTNSGALSFTVATTQVSSLVIGGWQTCSTTAGYADGAWHLVVATVNSSGCTITMDANPATTVTRSFGLTLMVGAFSGGWRFGYDALTSGIPNPPTRAYFKGRLDETQIYDSVISAGTQTVILNRGRGGSGA